MSKIKNLDPKIIRAINGESTLEDMKTNEKPRKGAFDEWAENWPSHYVTRNQITTFTEGFMSRQTMANLDSRGEGPRRFKMGKKVVYRVDDFIEWLEARGEYLGGGK